MNSVEFIGGPWDGRMMTVSSLDPITVYRSPRILANDDPGKEIEPEVVGVYKHGTRGWRGTMHWTEVGTDGN